MVTSVKRNRRDDEDLDINVTVDENEYTALLPVDDRASWKDCLSVRPGILEINDVVIHMLFRCDFWPRVDLLRTYAPREYRKSQEAMDQARKRFGDAWLVSKFVKFHRWCRVDGSPYDVKAVNRAWVMSKINTR